MPNDNTPEKCLTVRLFYNRSNFSFYIQVGGTLCIIPDKIATSVQQKENLDIIHVDSIKEMQEAAIKKINH